MVTEYLVERYRRQLRRTVQTLEEQAGEARRFMREYRAGELNAREAAAKIANLTHIYHEQLRLQVALLQEMSGEFPDRDEEEEEAGEVVPGREEGEIVAV